jgi:hypothetical protein
MRNAGYDVFLGEATIGFNKRSKTDQGEELIAGLKSGEMKWKVTAQDRTPSPLKISVADPDQQ